MELIDNGLDSLKRCIHDLKEAADLNASDRNYNYTIKDTIISLHHSIETLFKYLISKKAPYLIYDDINKYFKFEVEKKWNNSLKQDLNTIQFLDAVHCVLTIYEINMDKIVYTKIIKLNQDRNALTHYTMSFEHRVVENYITLLLPDLFKIFNIHIEEFEKFAKNNKFYEEIDSLQKDKFKMLTGITCF